MVRFHGHPHGMSNIDETFFTSVGCKDGRAQETVAEFGRKKFGAEYPDTITEAGLVGLLSKDAIDERLLDSLKKKIAISLEKHHSKGIIVHGHQECAALSAVSDEKHKEDVRSSVQAIKLLINSSVPVVGVFVKRFSNNPSVWEAGEI